jgi:hypothetical protein
VQPAATISSPAQIAPIRPEQRDIVIPPKGVEPHASLHAVSRRVPWRNHATSAGPTPVRERRFTTHPVNAHYLDPSSDGFYAANMRLWPLALLAAASCARAPEPRSDSTTVLGLFAAASARNDPHAAYQLLSTTTRAQRSETDFAAQWKASARELASQERRMRVVAAAGPLPRHAEIHFADGRTLALTRDAEGWRLMAVRPSDTDASSPQEALRRFVDALESHDFDALLRLLAEPLRGTVEQALGERLEHLRRAVRSGGIETSGDHARLRYDSRYHLDLVRENGQWRIADFN